MVMVMVMVMFGGGGVGRRRHRCIGKVSHAANVQEYEFFFEMKFGKKPKLTKKTT